MATFETSWSYGGATAVLQLVIDDPTGIDYTTTAIALAARLNLITNGAVNDSTNSNSLSGSITAGPAAASVSHASYPTGGSTQVISGSNSFAVLVGSSNTVTVTGTINGYDAFPGPHTVSGSVVIPPRPAAPGGVPSVGIRTLQETIDQNSIRLNGDVASANGSPIDGFNLRVWDQNGSFAAANVRDLVIGYGPWTIDDLVPNNIYGWALAAHNAFGWGPYGGQDGSWFLYTNPSGYANVGGSWRPFLAFAKVAGVWRVISQTYAKAGGAWRTW